MVCRACRQGSHLRDRRHSGKDLIVLKVCLILLGVHIDDGLVLDLEPYSPELNSPCHELDSTGNRHV
ncbi:hypothetical protein R52603_00676 [Paraburkholderia saeva]|uniref:Uncharacterized protein n=1 Tax=Paraburkholderia saeva TaxID=2777537 RepID=A0A9N8RWL8_9BURK|nr:hypothetical protein R52603_00676 [Paraburkholderia saeva]CAG4893385.1 hypothetical protein R70241_01560 [Paraburkholderia saeva]CAG4895755.1 hypothetical protein LMG31841_02221 [Paraburkholderia saeva]